MQKFKNNAIVYVNSAYNIAEKCEVIDYIENKSDAGKNYYKVHSVDNYGTFATAEDRIFATEEDAKKAYKKSLEDRVEQYKNEIRTLKDLLEFPLNHCISCGGEYTNHAAQKAYRARAAELTDIALSEQ